MLNCLKHLPIKYTRISALLFEKNVSQQRFQSTTGRFVKNSLKSLSTDSQSHRCQTMLVSPETLI